DVRLVAGDSWLSDELARKAEGQWQSRSDRWLPVVGQAVADRHERAGEVAFLLEPDLKEGRGGLRDGHAQNGAEAARRILLEGDEAVLASAYEMLLDVRVALHRRTGKPSDRLLLQEQDGIAADLGYSDADALMAEVAAAARTIAWTSDETWDRILSSVKGPRGRSTPGDRHVGPGVVIRDKLVELTAEADPLADPTLVLRAAAAAAEAGIRLSRPAVDRLAAEATPLGDPWPEEARLALVRLLGAGAAAIPVIETLDQRGLRTRTPPDDVTTIKALVRHHLLLAETATRRDLTDEATISAVAAAVGNHTTLELLAALTEADSLATGPAAWGTWKAGLIAELVERTAPVLAGHRHPSAPEPSPDGTVELIARARLAEPLVPDGEGPLVTVVAPDRPALLWLVAGTL